MAYSYIFKGSNIGPNGVTADTVDIPEMMYLISKKFFGYPNTIPDIIYSSELAPSKLSSRNIPSAFQNIYQSKMYSQQVPIPNPLSSNTVGTIFVFNPLSCYQDTTFSNYYNNTFYYYTQNISNDTLSSRWVCCNYPYLCYYSNILLTNYNPGSRYTTSLYSNYITTFINPLLVNAIPSTYDYSYNPQLFQNNGTTQILLPNGYWLLDTDAGNIVFYDSNTSGPIITTSNLPRISFFRYEGLFGEASILQGQEL
jgi:hypothetical protein